MPTMTMIAHIYIKMWIILHNERGRLINAEITPEIYRVEIPSHVEFRHCRDNNLCETSCSR